MCSVALWLVSGIAAAAGRAQAREAREDARAESPASRKELPEYKAKALYLLHFAKYVRWPAEAFNSPEAPIVVMVLGADPFGKVLEETLREQRLRNRPFKIERARTLAELRSCHILFVPRDSSALLKPALEALAGQSVLAVGESPGLAQKGAILNFCIEDAHIRFEVNLQAARKAGLEISSELLKLARKVESK